MSEKKPEGPFKIEMSDQVRTKMAEDPEMAKFLMEFMENVQKAKSLMDADKTLSFDDAMFEVTGTRPEPIDTDELPDHVIEEIENAKFTKPS